MPALPFKYKNKSRSSNSTLVKDSRNAVTFDIFFFRRAGREKIEKELIDD
jgi:hypothetical protein